MEKETTLTTNKTQLPDRQDPEEVTAAEEGEATVAKPETDGGGAVDAGQEETNAAAGGGSTPDVADLTMMLEDARAKADEHWNLAMRAKADVENLRKRQQKELENAHKFALACAHSVNASSQVLC